LHCALRLVRTQGRNVLRRPRARQDVGRRQAERSGRWGGGGGGGGGGARFRSSRAANRMASLLRSARLRGTWLIVHRNRSPLQRGVGPGCLAAGSIPLIVLAVMPLVETRFLPTSPTLRSASYRPCGQGMKCCDLSRPLPHLGIRLGDSSANDGPTRHIFGTAGASAGTQPSPPAAPRSEPSHVAPPPRKRRERVGVLDRLEASFAFQSVVASRR